MTPASDDMPVVLKYVLLGVCLLLGLPLVAALVWAEPVMSFVVLGCIVGGILLFKFVLKKYFSIHIVRWIPFFLWLFLTVLIGFMIYSLLNGDLTFKEMFSWGGRHSGGIFMLLLAWLIMTGLSFKKIPAGRPVGNALEAEQHEIDELYEKAFTQNDFDALCELVRNFYEGKNQKFFKKSPLQAAKVFEGAQRLVQIAEKGEEKTPELEDYYWLGLMYEMGFSGAPDFLKAIEYYDKALTTQKCWTQDVDDFRRLCKKVKHRLTTLQSRH